MQIASCVAIGVYFLGLGLYLTVFGWQLLATLVVFGVAAQARHPG